MWTLLFEMRESEREQESGRAGERESERARGRAHAETCVLGINLRFWGTYQDEDMCGRISKLASAVHPDRMAAAAIERYSLTMDSLLVAVGGGGLHG